MTTTVKATDTPTRPAGREAGQNSKLPGKLAKMNWIGGSLGWIWLFVVMAPIYWIIITSFKTQANYYFTNTFAPPTHPTLENYKTVLDNDVIRYFLNSVMVTAGAVVPAVVISFMAAYGIVRGIGNRWLRYTNTMFVMGLAIPLQAVIIPIYLIIIRLKLYDSLLAIVLPSIAFAIPLSVMVLSNFIRDVPRELFESMHLDGATEWGILWRLAFPLTRPALVTVTIYNALGIWNGFLLPLVLTTSPDKRTVPLGLFNFQGIFGVNFPAIAASVTLTTIPIVLLYAIGRRQLLSGLTAGFGK